MSDELVLEATPAPKSPPKDLTEELFNYLEEIKEFNSIDPAEVMQKISSFTARLSELKVRALLDGNHSANRLLTKQITPILEELERQFRVHSRLQAIRQHDWDAAKGQF